MASAHPTTALALSSSPLDSAKYVLVRTTADQAVSVDVGTVQGRPDTPVTVGVFTVHRQLDIYTSGIGSTLSVRADNGATFMISDRYATPPTNDGQMSADDNISRRTVSSQLAQIAFEVHTKGWSFRDESFSSEDGPTAIAYDPILKRAYTSSEQEGEPTFEYVSWGTTDRVSLATPPVCLNELCVSPNAERVFGIAKDHEELYVYHVDSGCWYEPVTLGFGPSAIAATTDSRGVLVADGQHVSLVPMKYGFGTEPAAAGASLVD